MSLASDIPAAAAAAATELAVAEAGAQRALAEWRAAGAPVLPGAGAQSSQGSEVGGWQMVPGSYAGGTAPPPPFVLQTSGGPQPPQVGPTCNLPDGIASIEEWGTTVIEFGKQQKGRAYEEVYYDEESASYVEWVLNNGGKKSGGGLHDFFLYCQAMRANSMETAKIPGTSIVRKLRRP